MKKKKINKFFLLSSLSWCNITTDILGSQRTFQALCQDLVVNKWPQFSVLLCVAIMPLNTYWGSDLHLDMLIAPHDVWSFIYEFKGEHQCITLAGHQFFSIEKCMILVQMEVPYCSLEGTCHSQSTLQNVHCLYCSQCFFIHCICPY